MGVACLLVAGGCGITDVRAAATCCVPPVVRVCRRFRALKLWFSLRMYGAEKLQELVRHHIALGEWLAEQVKADSRCGGFCQPGCWEQT